MNFIEERFTTPNRYPTEEEAKRARDARAKELRKLGYKVECKKWSFSGLGYGASYTLTARKDA